MLQQLYRDHASDVLAFLTGLCRDPDLAEDLMQDTFVRATRSIGGYRGGDPRSWLFAIARTTFLDDTRRRRPVPSSDLRDPGVRDPDAAEAHTVRATLARLPEPQRAALVLRDQLQLSTAETAAALSRTEGATRVLVHRARAAFRELYAREGGRA